MATVGSIAMIAEEVEMYGTIMRAKLKAGQQDAFRRFAQEQGSPADAGGWVSSEFAVEDKDPNRIVGIIRFKDKDSYVKNANTPQTNDNYNQMLKFLEGPPEWIDVHYVAFQGETLKEYMVTGSMPGA
jgi:quinol monooxygenase YgiN